MAGARWLFIGVRAFLQQIDFNSDVYDAAGNLLGNAADFDPSFDAATPSASGRYWGVHRSWPWEEILAALEPVYLYVFTFELGIKVLAYGLVGHPHSYLRDAWCQLDFVVVTLAWLPILYAHLQP